MLKIDVNVSKALRSLIAKSMASSEEDELPPEASTLLNFGIKTLATITLVTNNERLVDPATEIRDNDLTENWYTNVFGYYIGLHIYLLGKLAPLVERDIDKLRLLQQ